MGRSGTVLEQSGVEEQEAASTMGESANVIQCCVSSVSDSPYVKTQERKQELIVTRNEFPGVSRRDHKAVNVSSETLERFNERMRKEDGKEVNSHS